MHETLLGKHRAMQAATEASVLSHTDPARPSCHSGEKLLEHSNASGAYRAFNAQGAPSLLAVTCSMSNHLFSGIQLVRKWESRTLLEKGQLISCNLQVGKSHTNKVFTMSKSKKKIQCGYKGSKIVQE